MSQPRATITRGKRQESYGWPPVTTTVHTVMLDGHEAYSGSPAFAGAFTKGVRARLAGEPLDANPYIDWRTDRGAVTFSRAFWRHWKRGWEAADKLVSE